MNIDNNNPSNNNPTDLVPLLHLILTTTTLSSDLYPDRNGERTKNRSKLAINKDRARAPLRYVL